MIVVCGEALVDLVPEPAAPERYRAIPGGSPANTAVALARLGTDVQMRARLSGDGFGSLLRAHLARNGVGLEATVTASEPSSAALVTLDESGAASYRFLVDGTADWQWTDDELGTISVGTQAVHAGSLALARAPGAKALSRFLERSRAQCTVSVDPNVRPGLVGDLDGYRGQVREWLSLADLFKASSEDVEVLHPGRDVREVGREWAGAGPDLVVVTCGAEGSLAFVRGAEVAVPALPVEVVDTVGAGDTFTAGLLDWLSRAQALGGRLDGLSATDAREALRHAAAAAAITCSRRGAEPPWRAELPVGH